MGNRNLIITIEREYGSGGRIVGRKLAEDLGIHFYDDEILKLTSEKSAIGEEYFAWRTKRPEITCFTGLWAGSWILQRSRC